MCLAWSLSGSGSSQWVSLAGKGQREWRRRKIPRAGPGGSGFHSRASTGPRFLRFLNGSPPIHCSSAHLCSPLRASRQEASALTASIGFRHELRPPLVLVAQLHGSSALLRSMLRASRQEASALTGFIGFTHPAALSHPSDPSFLFTYAHTAWHE